MAQTVSILLQDDDGARLAAIVGDRNRPQKHVLRARIVLLSADRLSVLDVARQAGASRPAVWRWQRRFAEDGVDGLLRDKTRKPGKKPLSAATIAKVLALPCSEPPGEATHWTGRMVTGISKQGDGYIRRLRSPTIAANRAPSSSWRRMLTVCAMRPESHESRPP